MLALALLLAPFAVPRVVAAQESQCYVPQGRTFEQQKLLTPGQTDVWNLDVAAEEVLHVQLHSDAFDPVLTVVDPDGQTVVTQDGQGTHCDLRIRTDKHGRYRCEVAPFRGAGGGNYHFKVVRWRTQPIAANGEGSHHFGREMWTHYRVQLAAGDVLVPTIVGAGVVTAVEHEDGRALQQLAGGYRAEVDAMHYVRVEGAFDERGELLTQLARRDERSLGDRRNERIPPFGLDRWCIAVPAGTVVALELRSTGALACHTFDPQPDRDGARITPMRDFDKGGARRRLFFARRDATVACAVRNEAATAADYEFAALRVGAPVPLGSVHQGVLPLGDAAVFELDLALGEVVDLTAASDVFDAEFELWDPRGEQHATADDHSLLDRTARHRFLVPHAGLWRVLVHSGGGRASGPFTLRAEREVVPTVRIGERIEVRPNHYLQLDLPAGAVVWVSLRSAQFDAWVQITRPNGAQPWHAHGGGLGTDVLAAFRAEHAGRHTLELHVVQP